MDHLVQAEAAEAERAADPEPVVSGVGSALVKASRLPLVTLLGNKTDLAHLREVTIDHKQLHDDPSDPG